MPWAPRGDADPALTTKAWRKQREYWKQFGLPCARCGREIDYFGPRYYLVAGRRKINPRYFCLGHKVSRREARALGWSEARINAPSNLQAECQRCSNSSGAKLGRRLQDGPRQGSVTPAPKPRVENRW
jgi:hypothetical protein